MKRLHVTLDDTELPEILDRIIDRGVGFDPTLLLSLLQAEGPQSHPSVSVKSVQTNTTSYARPAEHMPYQPIRRMRGPE